MATNVTINQSAASTVTIKPSKTTVSSVTVSPSSNIALGNLTNVDVANAVNGQGLVFNSTTNKFEAQNFTVDANNITNISGGLF
jgi:hypothetical protein